MGGHLCRRTFSSRHLADSPASGGVTFFLSQHARSVVEVEEDAVGQVADFGPVGGGGVVVHGPDLHAD